MKRRIDRSKKSNEDGRPRQLVIGLGILAVLILTVPAFYVVWRLVPGVFGEWLGVIAGVMSTPFLLEFFFIVCGLVIVVGLNVWRQKREGDDFVYLEDDPGAPSDLPERSRHAVYRDRPLDGVDPGVIDRIAGALETGDHAKAADLLAGLGDAELRAPVVLALRLRLARATGKEDLARRIEREMSPSQP